MPQATKMTFCPSTGTENPFPSNAAFWRGFHGNKPWRYNPWTGLARAENDVFSDWQGLLILAPGDERDPILLEMLNSAQGAIRRIARAGWRARVIDLDDMVVNVTKGSGVDAQDYHYRLTDEEERRSFFALVRQAKPVYFDPDEI